MIDIEVMREHGFLTSDNKAFTESIHKAVADEKSVAKIFGALFVDDLVDVDVKTDVDISEITAGIQDFLQRYLNPTPKSSRSTQT